MSLLRGARMLVVDDEPAVLKPIVCYFEQLGAEVVEADSVAGALERLSEGSPDVALLDLSLPDGTGLDLVRALRGSDAQVPSVVLTGHGTIERAVAAIKEGAEQFLTKPVELATLAVVVERLLEHQHDRALSRLARARVERGGRNPFLGSDPALGRLAAVAERAAAAANLPVLIRGETGSGKGVLAEWLHRASPRAGAAFVEVNCAGLSRELLESEIFGHERGAFTGAVASKPGLLEAAHRGTLFLDEIGDMDLAIQAKLLKVVEDMRFRRLGDVRDRRVDVWLLAATHRDLATLVAEGRFRQDLLYRLNAVEVAMPSLRDRAGDIPILAKALLQRLGQRKGRRLTLSDEAAAALRAHAWPGNVRELQNVLERAALLADGETIAAADLHIATARQLAVAPPRSEPPMTLEQVERAHVEQAMRREEGNVSRAAKALGISRSALYEKIRRHGLAGTPRA